MRLKFPLSLFFAFITGYTSFAQTAPDSIKGVAINVEEMPEFPGGESELYSFLSKNLEYPELAQKNRIEGKIAVRFVVDIDGSISKIEIAKRIGWGCDEEAIRVLKLMPKWKPGKEKGKAVPVYFTLPIMFKLSK
jgi:periplasmic protein TonB